MMIGYDQAKEVDDDLPQNIVSARETYRPSGENVFTPRSYSVLVKYISVINRQMKQ
jgi:hypothetical protein